MVHPPQNLVRFIRNICSSAIICLLLVMGMACQGIAQSRAQKQSQQLEILEKEWNNSISAADSTNLQITLGEFYSRHYRAIASYMLQSFDALRQLNVQSATVEKPGKLQESLSLWKKSQALLGKTQIIDKKVKALPDLKGYVSGLGLVSDRRLVLEHYEFLLYLENNHDQLEQVPSLKDHTFQHIGFLEEEMKKRRLYPSNSGSSSLTLLQQRYELIKEFQAAAIKEAYSLGDASPEIAVHRRTLIDVLQEINSIQDRLGLSSIKATDLLSEKTLQKRVAIQQHAYRQVLKNHHLQKHFNPQLKQHLSILEESLAIDQQALFNFQTIDGIRWRGPPLPPPADIFSPTPLPPPPSDGKFGLSLNMFLSEQDIAKADIKGVEKAEKQIQRSLEKLHALVPSLKTGPVADRRVSSNAKKRGTPSIRDELEFRSNSIWDAVEAGDIQTAEYRTMDFADYREVMAPEIPISLNDFVATEERPNRLATLKILKQSLENAKAKGVYPLIRTDFDHEIRVVNDLIEVLNTTNSDPARIEKLTGWVTRPPPAESVEEKMLTRRLRNAEIMHASYGSNLNPSIGYDYKINTQTRAIRESRAILTSVQQYTEGENTAVIKLLQNLPPEKIEQLGLQDYVKELRSEEQLLAEKVNRTLARANAAATNFELPAGIITELKKAQKSLPPPKYSPNVPEINWRPAQSLEKVREMVPHKAPGGVWLSPGVQLVRRDTSSQELWTIVPLEKTCVDSTEYGQWILNDKSKICFSDPFLTTQKDHWLYQLKPWR